MVRIRSKIVVFVIMMVVGLLVFSPSTQAAGKTVYVGGTMSLTGRLCRGLRRRCWLPMRTMSNM